MEGEEKGKGRPGGKKEREVKEKRIGSEVEGKNEGIRNGEKYEKGWERKYEISGNFIHPGNII